MTASKNSFLQAGRSATRLD